jgi:hypothetical protein
MGWFAVSLRCFCATDGTGSKTGMNSISRNIPQNATGKRVAFLTKKGGFLMAAGLFLQEARQQFGAEYGI